MSSSTPVGISRNLRTGTVAQPMVKTVTRTIIIVVMRNTSRLPLASGNTCGEWRVMRRCGAVQLANLKNERQTPQPLHLGASKGDGAAESAEENHVLLIWLNRPFVLAPTATNADPHTRVGKG